ncbi:MAG: class I SAM-dependent methyltransferase [Anaerolineae bacterium]|nr:class I SAM-dependent methyltransferase [Anaerolineae bacterium]
MYPLTLKLVDFLFTDGARQSLAGLAEADLSDSATLAQLTALRRHFASDEAAVLLDQARLRRKAMAKFPHAAQMFFTDEALQQASSRAVALYRAQQFARFHTVADLGCGIGGDTLAMAEAGLTVLAVELDPVRARLAEANIAVCGLADRVQILCADWTALTFTADAAFIDPARRVDDRRGGRRRVFSLHAMEPPLSTIFTLMARIPDVAVKVAPGVDDAEVPVAAEVEFISERGLLKEALLRFGALHTGSVRQATVLPGPFTLDSDAPLDDIESHAPATYLYEPNPAILRAKLVRHLATQIGAAQLDPDIAYLTSDLLVSTPFARAWSVLHHGHFNLKTLNRWLREIGAGEVIVKKRGSAIEPDAFRRRLKTTPGGPTLTVFLTQVCGQPWMILGQWVVNAVY